MPLHVRISVAGESADETKVDLTEDQLATQFLAPFRNGDPITVNGRSISPENLERIRITETESEARSYFDQLRARDERSNVVVLGGPSMLWRAAGLGLDLTDEYIKGPSGYARNDREHGESQVRQLNRVTVPSGPGDGRSIFLVQGRNDALNSSTTSFLQSLDLKVIEWEQAIAETGEPNPYIGDVILAGLEMAHGVVVLATPDDIAHLDSDLTSDSNDDALAAAGQPRQNVMFEAGMAMALAPTRTLVIAITKTRIASDIAGRHLVYLDGTPETRKKIVGRLQTMGLAVDDSGTGWLSAGEF